MTFNLSRMPPPRLLCRIALKLRWTGDVELRSDVTDHSRRYPGRRAQERTKKTNRTQLQREIEAITCRTQTPNVTEIGVIEMEISGELFAFGFAVVAAIVTAVLLAKDWQRNNLIVIAPDFCSSSRRGNRRIVELCNCYRNEEDKRKDKQERQVIS